MSVQVFRNGRVRLRTTITVDAPRPLVWKALADLTTVAQLETFHRRMELHGPIGEGTTFHLIHGLFGVELRRRGSILKWRHGFGYAFSDLSLRGKRVGFPHVFDLTLEPVGPRRTLIHFTITGKWTMPLLPRVFAGAWLGWVFYKMRAAIECYVLGTIVSSLPAVSPDGGGAVSGPSRPQTASGSAR